MSNAKDSLKIKESLVMNGRELTINKNSGRLIGEVLVEEFDNYGNNIFSETTFNDVTLPGSIFVLEQIFKTVSNSGYRFLHDSKVPIGTFGSDTQATGIMTTVDNKDDDKTEWNNINSIDNKYISDEYIFGFMVGYGGETSTSVVAPRYEASVLEDSNNVASFLPIRVVDSDSIDPVDEGINYHIKYTDTDNKKTYFYGKSFNSQPIIYTRWADGSGNVQKGKLDYNIPILTYAEVKLKISELDIREYFSATNSEQCYINQLGLVAGKPIWVQDKTGTFKKNNDGSYESVDSSYTGTRYRLDFDDVKLVTTLNFKSKDLSNDENTIMFTYKVYCL